MSKYPQYIQINDVKLKINTDFKVALRCNAISMDNSICDLEKELAIIYILLGEDGLNCTDDYDKLFELIIKYLNHGKPLEISNEKPSMDFIQDEAYIKASFMSDYKINLNETSMHWWEYLELLSGLTEHSVLNRVRAIREEPLGDKKGKELDKWIRLKESVALEEVIVKTDEEKRLDEYWEKVLRKE